MSIPSNLTSDGQIKAIFYKEYQTRTLVEHKIVVQILQPFFPTLTPNTVKLISFYIELIQASSQFQRENDNQHQKGILIKVQSRQQTQKNPESHNEQIMAKAQKIIPKQTQAFSLFIAYDDYLSCLSLGDTTIEDQLAFFHSSEYLCSMPRKKYFNILRTSKVLSFSFHQSIYFEGQLISPGESGSGVYLVRHGQLAYIKNIKGKNVEVFRFGQGHLLGTLQLQAKQKKRLFTVKVKNSRSIVYQMSQEFFNSYIKPYCEAVITKKQRKLQKFLTEKSYEMTQFRKSQPSLSLTTRRSFNSMDENNQNQKLQKTQTVNMFTSRQLPSLIKTSRLSAQIEEDELRKTSYLGLKYDGPLKNYPMASQRSKFMESQFKDLQKLKQKNEKINKIRSIKKNNSAQSKDQILFGLFQQSWKFDKLKRKRNNLIF